jgi:esterase/lipase superfamily enzyme
MRLFTGTDDKLSLHKTLPCPSEEFSRQISAKINEFSPSEQSVLIYIHGYNTKFADAAMRTAQIAFDLNIPGAAAFFSWPSQGEVGAYIEDGEIIAASEQHIADFISTVAKAAGAAKVNVIAHSMGNRGLLRALTSATAQAALAGVRFGQVFLAAPDVDANLFRQLARVYPRVSDRTTLYVSAADRALGLSRLISNTQRIGYTPPVTIVPGIDTVEATKVDVGWLGHGYYAEAASVMYDMASLIRRNDAPTRE